MDTWPSLDFETMTINQVDLAFTLNVDRSTVRKMQKEGLPYTLGDKRECRFVIPVAMHWTVGREIAKKVELEISHPIIMYCLGWIHGANLDHEITSITILNQEAERANISDQFDCSPDKFNNFFAIALGLYSAKFDTRWQL